MLLYIVLYYTYMKAQKYRDGLKGRPCRQSIFKTMYFLLMIVCNLSHGHKFLGFLSKSTALENIRDQIVTIRFCPTWRGSSNLDSKSVKISASRRESSATTCKAWENTEEPRLT